MCVKDREVQGGDVASGSVLPKWDGGGGYRKK